MRDAVLELGLMDAAELDAALDAYAMRGRDGVRWCRA